MRAAAGTLDRLRQAHDFGIMINGDIFPDMPGLMARMDKVIENQARGIRSLLDHHQIHYLNGRGAILKPNLARATFPDNSISDIPWDGLILCPGSAPLELSRFPFDGQKILSSDHILRLRELPGTIAIVGGGVIGCEFAFILNALGVGVTVIEALSRILPLPGIDKSCSKVLQREMKKRKIRLLVDSCLERVYQVQNKLQLTVGPYGPAFDRSPESHRPETIEVEKLLVCVGRRSLTENIGLETIALRTDTQGWIIANERMETNVPGVYAIGDVLGPAKIMLAHVASTEGAVAVENALGGNRLMEYETVPIAIYTSPEVAGVGLSEDQAREQGYQFASSVVLFRNLGKAQVDNELSGEIKIIHDIDNGKVLGVHIIGSHATELIAEAALAIKTGCTLENLADTIHAHPTLSEAMSEVSFKALGKPLHG